MSTGSSGVLFRSEVLFYVQNNVASVADDILVATLLFYNEEELVIAKNALYAVANTTSSSTESLPRLRQRRGDKKRENDASDIIELWRVLDREKAELPIFVAADQKRIPPVTVSGSDLSVMSVSMIEMKTQLCELAAAQKRLTDVVSSMQGKLLQLPEKLSDQSTRESEFPALGVSSKAAQVNHVDNSSTLKALSAPADNNTSNNSSWTHIVEAMSAAGGIQIPPHKPVPHKVMRGKNVSAGPRVVPRRLAAFVGRLHTDTTEEELKDYLLNAGLVNAYCKKLPAKGTQKFNTSAFMVTCDFCCKDRFFDESVWPEGCELREWVFRKRPEQSIV